VQQTVGQFVTAHARRNGQAQTDQGDGTAEKHQADNKEG
jgi:hypothetical protein